MKTEQLIPLCRRYHAMLLHSDEQTISIAVVNTPPAELMEALALRDAKSGSTLNAGAGSRWISVCRPGKAGATGAEPTGRKISPNGSTRSSNRPCVSGRLIFISSPRKRTLRIRLRVDGVLHALPLLAPELAAPVIARPQGPGQSRYRRAPFTAGWPVRAESCGTTALFRIATLPCRYGERLSCAFIRLTRRWIWKHSDSHPPSWRPFARR